MDLVTQIKKSYALVPEAVDAYISSQNLLYKPEVETYREYILNRDGVQKMCEAISLFNAALSKAAPNSAEGWSIICQLYEKIAATRKVVYGSTHRWKTDVFELQTSSTDALGWLYKISENHETTAIDFIQNFMANYKVVTEKFGIICIDSLKKYLKEETLYENEHMYYISSINENWGKALLTGGISERLRGIIHQRCPNFVKLYDSIYIIDDEEIVALKESAEVFKTIGDFKREYPACKL